MLPANLTSGGMMIPATVPHSGQESSKGTAPIYEDGIEVPRTTETFPRVIGRDDSGAQPDLKVGYMAGFMMAPSGTTPSTANRHRAVPRNIG